MDTPELGFIHRFIAPSEPDSRVTLLLLHGTGGNEDDLLPIGKELLPGAALLSPRGKGLEQGMPRFFRRLAEGVFDLEDLRLRTEELAQFIAAAKARYDLAGRIVAVGYSNGANIASSLMFTHPGVLAGAVLFRPMVPFTPQSPPALSGVPVLLAGGQRDPIVASEQTTRLAGIFQAAGAMVSVYWHPGGHELGRDDLIAAKSWLSNSLAPA